MLLIHKYTRVYTYKIYKYKIDIKNNKVRLEFLNDKIIR